MEEVFCVVNCGGERWAITLEGFQGGCIVASSPRPFKYQQIEFETNYRNFKGLLKSMHMRKSKALRWSVEIEATIPYKVYMDWLGLTQEYTLADYKDWSGL